MVLQAPVLLLYTDDEVAWEVRSAVLGSSGGGSLMDDADEGDDGGLSLLQRGANGTVRQGDGSAARVRVCFPFNFFIYLLFSRISRTSLFISLSLSLSLSHTHAHALTLTQHSRSPLRVNCCVRLSCGRAAGCTRQSCCGTSLSAPRTAA